MSKNVIEEIMTKLILHFPGVNYLFTEEQYGLEFSFSVEEDRNSIWSYLLYYQKIHPNRIALVMRSKAKNNKYFGLKVLGTEITKHLSDPV